MLPWSVMPRAGCSSAAAAATTSSTRDAPSSIENSVCTWRWAKLSGTCAASLLRTSTPHPQQLSTACGRSYIGVISYRTTGRGPLEPPRHVLSAIACASQARSEVGAWSVAAGFGGLAGRELAAHVLELLAGLHLLGEQRGLDAVE